MYAYLSPKEVFEIHFEALLSKKYLICRLAVPFAVLHVITTTLYEYMSEK